jgi:hypothetical protein
VVEGKPERIQIAPGVKHDEDSVSSSDGIAHDASTDGQQCTELLERLSYSGI